MRLWVAWLREISKKAFGLSSFDFIIYPQEKSSPTKNAANKNPSTGKCKSPKIIAETIINILLFLVNLLIIVIGKNWPSKVSIGGAIITAPIKSVVFIWGSWRSDIKGG